MKTTDIRCNIRYTVDNRRQWSRNWDSNTDTAEYMLLRKARLKW